jgi:hypothetical protein
MKRVPPTQGSLLLPCSISESRERIAADATTSTGLAAVVDLSKWRKRSVEADQSALVAAVCERAAHLSELVSPRSKG